MVFVIVVVDYLRGANAIALAGYGGAIAGVLHHLLIQYPRQAAIFVTIYSFIAGSIGFAFLFWHISNNRSVGSTLLTMGLFDLIYVFFICFARLTD